MSIAQDTHTDPTALFRLIYRSHSRIPETARGEELGRILRVARTNNAALGITGALMLYGRWFAQALEGPEAAVLGLFDKIRRDPRHDAVAVSTQGHVPARVFARWAMAHVGEHGSADIPLTATQSGVQPAASWMPSDEQEAVLGNLRDLTRGYGIGA